jgi:hypothetical protein
MRCPLCIIGGKNTNTAMTATVREPYPNNLHQVPPSTRSPITETTARTRDYTASVLSNERVRGVVGVVDIFTIDFTVAFTSGPPGWGNYVTEFLTVSHC